MVVPGPESPCRLAGCPSPEQLVVETLGAPRFASPIPPPASGFVDDADRVLVHARADDVERHVAASRPLPSFEPAGPRARIFFDPRAIACGIVTCGGLCPGLNDVVRSLVLRLHHAYGVPRILGFRYGYAGLAPDGPAPLPLTPAVVEHLHEQGGTLLGTSRGPQDVDAMLATLVRHGVGILFVCGGDGGLRGALAIGTAARRRGLPLAVIGIPKTIDNDLAWTWRSFGLATAVDAAHGIIRAAHVEARAAWNGVGLVKLMGRHAGFIAAHATLANSDVNFCLVPEVPFTLDGTGGFLDALARRLADKPHAVVVVAEGAGQDLMASGATAPERDASGNVRLQDIGTFLRDRIRDHFAGRPVNVRYFDPSYEIRSQPANSSDAEYCLVLAQHAVHAGMAGRTNMLVGSWNLQFTHVPIALAVAERRCLDPASEEWQHVLEATGQPASLVGR